MYCNGKELDKHFIENKKFMAQKNININENKLTTTATMTKKSHPCGMWNRQCHTCHTQISE